MPPAVAQALQPVAGNNAAQAYQLYRATTNFVSPDGKTIHFLAGLSAGDPSTTSSRTSTNVSLAAPTQIRSARNARRPPS